MIKELSKNDSSFIFDLQNQNEINEILKCILK